MGLLRQSFRRKKEMSKELVPSVKLETVTVRVQRGTMLCDREVVNKTGHPYQLYGFHYPMRVWAFNRVFDVPATEATCPRNWFMTQ